MHWPEAQAQELNGGSRAKVAGKTSNNSSIDKRDPNYIAIEQKFIDVFGTKVQLKGDFSKGTITVHYFTKDDLSRIYDIIARENS